MQKTDIPFLIALPLLVMVLTPVTAVVALIGMATGRDRLGNWVHPICALWGRCLVKLSPVRVLVRGRETVPKGPFIIVSNHQSAIDTGLFLSQIPFQYRHFGHRRFFRFLWAMYFARYIPVDTDKPQETRERLLKYGGEFLRQGISILIFAEGSRTQDGRMKPFKSGAFELALANQAPILPIAIRGSFQLMKKGSFRLHPGEVTMKFLPPIQPGDHTVDTLRDLTRKAIISHVEGGA